jgi:predicted HicB family RNase H-like nuclease
MNIKRPVKIEYKGYTVEFTHELDRLDRSEYWFGKVMFIKDLICIIVESPSAMQLEVISAIDEYIEDCKELGVEPNKPEVPT